MKILKRYIIVVAIALPVLILVTIKTFNTAGFKYDAKRWSMPSFNGSNLVSTADTAMLRGNKLIIILDNVSKKEKGFSAFTVMIPPGSILDRKYLRLMRDHEGPVLLCSVDPSLSARMWMVLSQTGLKNLYILTTDKANEVFKNKFRPDTITRPEFAK